MLIVPQRLADILAGATPKREELAALVAVVSHIRGRRDELAATEDWHDFCLAMRLLTPQSYGARIEARLREFYRWQKAVRSREPGDAIDDGTLVEMKVTLISTSNRRANFVQIRPQQHVDYRLFVIDEHAAVTRFDLTREQMAGELARIGEAAHTTAGREEWGVRLTLDGGEHHRRWIERYRHDGPTPDNPAGGTPLLTAAVQR